MADRKEEIEFGGQIIKVPAWATESQMEVLNKLSADNLKEVQKLRALDKGILTAVTKMMSDNERIKSKETKENEKILKTIEGLDKTIIENITKQAGSKATAIGRKFAADAKAKVQQAYEIAPELKPKKGKGRPSKDSSIFEG